MTRSTCFITAENRFLLAIWGGMPQSAGGGGWSTVGHSSAVGSSYRPRWEHTASGRLIGPLRQELLELTELHVDSTPFDMAWICMKHGAIQPIYLSFCWCVGKNNCIKLAVISCHRLGRLRCFWRMEVAILEGFQQGERWSFSIVFWHVKGACATHYLQTGGFSTSWRCQKWSALVIWQNWGMSLDPVSMTGMTSLQSLQ